MDLRPPFEATSGSLDDSFARSGGRWRLVFVESGGWYGRSRDGLLRYEAPFVLSVSGLGPSWTRPEAARGVLLSFLPRLEDEAAFALGGDSYPIGTGAAAFVRLPAGEAERYRRLFLGILEAWDGGGLGPVLVKTTDLLRALRRLRGEGLRASRADRSERAADASAILDYLKAHFREPLSLEELAEKLGYSPTYLSRYFRKKTGRCLFEYVNARRVAEACALLKGTDKTVTEIAFEVGYNNLSFFNRYFRRLMDASPQEYRRRSKGG